MLVLDTSAYLNGRKDHYPPTTFPSVWEVIAEAMNDGRIIPARQVYRELIAKDDDVAAWTRGLASAFLDPSPEVQRAAGVIYSHVPLGCWPPRRRRPVRDR